MNIGSGQARSGQTAGHAALSARAGLARLVLDCCAQDVRAFKPGNVAIGAPGHAMSAEDFLRSAVAAAAPLTEPGARVGARIEAAVAATWQVVDCNTNLGIVLLLAPLLHAAERVLVAGSAGSAGQDAHPVFRTAIRTTLAALDQADAAACYRAIRQARPGGLGQAAQHDVAAEPAITLLDAMRAAAGRDGVASEYASGYAQVFDTALPCLRDAEAAGEADLWASTRCYLRLLAARPDSHVARRHGSALAGQVSARASQLLQGWPPGAAVGPVWPQLRACDREWKAAGINPGTTADLLVASLAVMRLQQALRYNGARQVPAAQSLRGRPDSVAPGKRAWAHSH